MSTLIAIGYPDETTAGSAAEEAHRMARDLILEAEAIAAIKRAYRTLYRAGLSLADARAQIERDAGTHPELAPMAEFLATSERGLLR